MAQVFHNRAEESFALDANQQEKERFFASLYYHAQFSFRAS